MGDFGDIGIGLNILLTDTNISVIGIGIGISLSVELLYKYKFGESLSWKPACLLNTKHCFEALTIHCIQAEE